LLSAEDITVTFKRRDGSSFAALDRVSLQVPDGGAVGLVGESGSGKTTLVRVICGLQKPDSGRVFFGRDEERTTVKRSNGQTVQYSARMACRPGGIQMIFQDAVGALDPRQRVGDAIAEVGRVHRLEVDVDGLLKQVGLPTEIKARFPNELSGGQCQRICVARALALRPSLLIGDEPVSALDVSVQARILRLLGDLREKQGLSLLLITHDLAVVSAVCDYVYVLEKGRMVEEGVPEAVFASPKHPYTRRLLASVPSLT
jgi:peptide/nickel transport system ATP-binding protein